MPLTRRQQRFVAEYLIDMNGAAAARRMGVSAASARTAAWRMLRRPGVRAAVEAELARRRSTSAISLDAVLGELARVAFFDPADMVNEAGEPLPLRRIDRNARAGIGRMELLETAAGEETPASRRMKARPGEKVRALVALQRYIERGNDLFRHNKWEAEMRAQGFEIRGGVARKKII